MKIISNNEIPLDLWKDFIRKNKFASPFQSPEYYNLFNSVEGISSLAIAVIDSKRILALAVVTLQSESGLKSYFSRRGIIYGGPLIDNENQKALSVLLDQIVLKFKKETIYIEIRNLSDYSHFKDIFLLHGYKYTPYLNYKIKTSDLASMLSCISNSRLRQIRKAQKNNVTWREARDQKEVFLFYQILNRLYKYKIGKPLPSNNFFKLFFEEELGKFLLVLYNNKIIGGIMCPIMEGKAIYEFYVCGLDDEYKEQYPSVMATWAAMEYANQNNIPLFDFMGAGKPNEYYGVRNFKARFGGELVEYGRFIKINKPFLYEMGKAGLKIMRKQKLNENTD